MKVFITLQLLHLCVSQPNENLLHFSMGIAKEWQHSSIVFLGSISDSTLEWLKHSINTVSVSEGLFMAFWDLEHQRVLKESTNNLGVILDVDDHVNSSLENIEFSSNKVFYLRTFIFNYSFFLRNVNYIS